jgi:hypothetical protein
MPVATSHWFAVVRAVSCSLQWKAEVGMRRTGGSSLVLGIVLAAGLVASNPAIAADERDYVPPATPFHYLGPAVGEHAIRATFASDWIAVSDASDAEGNVGTTAYNFTVTRMGGSALPITVTYETVDGTATAAGNDYVATSGSVVIPGDSFSATITVPVQGDTTFEAHESFYVRLTEATNATIVDNTGVGTIRNDDQHPLLRDFYVTNGTVNATALSPAGDVLYLGGVFTQVGRMIGSWVEIDGTTGQAVAPLPLVTDTVFAAAPDEQGGWFIGGAFTAVMGVPRLRLAHILPGGGLSEWNPGADSTVYALAVSGSTVYAGGHFGTIGGQTRSRVAALDATTGTATAWNPSASGPVRTLAVNGSTVYAGGDFTTIGGLARNRIAALTETAGGATAWAPNANGPVRTLAVNGSTIYAGGDFTTIGGQTRNRIAALDATTGNATAWDPNAGSTVHALALSGSTVYAGGGFTTIGGQTRNRVAALDAAVNTNNATAWNPNASSTVYALAVSGSTVIAGGSFATIGGQTRNRLAALDATAGTATAWNPNASGSVYALGVNGSNVYAGGSFATIGGQTRNRLAALDVATGIPTGWDPNSNGPVNALAVSGSIVYAGGGFATIGEQTRHRIAALDATTGLATPWNPNAYNAVNALAVSGSTVYAGGMFEFVGGLDRLYIAALDAGTGLATDWFPEVGGYVHALAVSGAMVYAGGEFGGITALDAATGTAPAWNVSTNGSVYALAVSGSTIYAGGDFTTIAGQTRRNIAALDAGTGIATAWNWDWNPNALASRVTALAVDESNVYVGGFSLVAMGGHIRGLFAALDRTTGLAADWVPSVDHGSADGYFHAVSALALGNGTLYAGGGFFSLGNLPSSGIAAIRLPSSAPTGVEEVAAMPQQVMLAQSYPNPARVGAVIRFGLPRAGQVSLRVYDISGRLVHVLLDGKRPAGWHSVQWNRSEVPGGRLAAGIYLYELRTSGTRLTRKLVMLE